MILDYETLKLIWLFLIGFLFIGFAITGGGDLGVAALLPFLGKTDEERRLMLNSIGATWEGNQVWFITAAGALFAAWPFMYAAAFSSLYFALLLVLLALILRPPGFDYRGKLPSLQWRLFWDWCLFFSGVAPLFLFGVAFGNLLTGIPFRYDDSLRPILTGNFFALLNPFTILTGIICLTLSLTQGALFLQIKTTQFLNKRAVKAARIFGILFMLAFIWGVWWTLFKSTGYTILSMPNANESFTPLMKEVNIGIGFWRLNYEQFSWGVIIPILSLMGTSIALIFSAYRCPIIAIVFNSISIASVLVTVGFTLFPFIMPSSTVPNHSLTIWDAASSQLTLMWMLVATVIFLPIVLMYTTWVYRVMRGKVHTDQLKDSESY